MQRGVTSGVQWVLPIVDGRRPVGAFDFFYCPMTRILATTASGESKFRVLVAKT